MHPSLGGCPTAVLHDPSIGTHQMHCLSMTGRDCRLD